MFDGPTIRPLRLVPNKQFSRTLQNSPELSPLPTLVTLVVYCVVRKSKKEILAEVRMFSRLCLALVLGLAAALAQQTTPQTQAGAQPAIPETPAGRTFKPGSKPSTTATACRWILTSISTIPASPWTTRC